MKEIVVSCLLLVVSCVCFAQRDSSIKYIHEENDTAIIIYKHANGDPQHYLFIDKRKNSPYYPHYSGTGTDSGFVAVVSDQSTIFRNTYHIHSKEIKNDPGFANLKGSWEKLISFDNKNYIYKPCDGIFVSSWEITDSAIIYWSTTYIAVFPYLSFKQISKNEFYFNSCIITYENTIPEIKTKMDSVKLSIFITDQKTQASVWKIEYPERTDYELLVPRKNERKFGIIVNSCHGDKQREFDCDAVDYEKLIAESKRKK